MRKDGVSSLNKGSTKERDEKGSLLLEACLAIGVTALLGLFILSLITRHIEEKKEAATEHYLYALTRAFADWADARDFRRRIVAGEDIWADAPPTLASLKAEGFLSNHFSERAPAGNAPRLAFMRGGLSSPRGEVAELLDLVIWIPAIFSDSPERRARILAGLERRGLSAGHVAAGELILKNGRRLDLDALMVNNDAGEGIAVALTHILRGVHKSGSAKRITFDLNRDPLSAALGRALERALSDYERQMREYLTEFDFAAMNPPHRLRLREVIAPDGTPAYEIPEHICPEGTSASVNIYDGDGFSKSLMTGDGFARSSGAGATITIIDKRSVTVPHGTGQRMPIRIRREHHDGRIDPAPLFLLSGFAPDGESWDYAPRRHSAHSSRLASLIGAGASDAPPARNPYFRLPPKEDISDGLALPMAPNPLITPPPMTLPQPPKGAVLKRKGDGSGWILNRFYREVSGLGEGLDAAEFPMIGIAPQEIREQRCFLDIMLYSNLCGGLWRRYKFWTGHEVGGTFSTSYAAIPTKESWARVSSCARAMQSRGHVRAKITMAIEERLPQLDFTAALGIAERTGLSCDWTPKKDIRVVRKCVVDYASYGRLRPLVKKLGAPAP